VRIIAPLAFVAFLLAGCTASKSSAPIPAAPPQSDPVSAPAPDPPNDTAASLKVSRLDQLWQSRHAAPAEFFIGTGDVIAVSVPGLPDYDNSAGAGASAGATAGSETGEQPAGGWTVRVNTIGDIILPLLGRIHVSGLTEDQLRALLLQRLGKYMYDPQVEVFVRSYNSRQVAISGEVHSPGMYTINRPNETIRDLIMRAGGTTDNAAQRIILTPQPPKVHLQHAALSEGFDTEGSASNDTASIAAGMSVSSRSYVIDLSKGQSGDRYLNLPVRPGDTIYVPRAGTATVIGWVYSPKTIDVTPGLTVLNAVSQAGGTWFAADTEHVKILRQAPHHETKTLMVNLKDIRSGSAPDVPLQANDVVDVSYNPLRIPAYALYYGAQGLVTMAPAALIFSGGL